MLFWTGRVVEPLISKAGFRIRIGKLRHKGCWTILVDPTRESNSRPDSVASRSAALETAVLSFGQLVRFSEIEIIVVVPVMMPHPVAEVKTGTGLVASLGRQI